jgi:hypothetical protein
MVEYVGAAVGGAIAGFVLGARVERFLRRSTRIDVHWHVGSAEPEGAAPSAGSAPGGDDGPAHEVDREGS